MNAIILAGGEGKRLASIAKDIPKPMVKIMGTPLLEYQIRWLRKNGIKDIVLAVHHMHEVIEQHFGDGSKFGVSIRYAVEESPLGTSGCVKLAAQHLDDTFLVFYGDNLTNLDVNQMLRFHKEKKALGTVFVYHEPLIDANTTPGVIIVGPDGRIKRMIERPNEEERAWIATLPPEQRLTNTGIYIFEKSMLELIPEGFSDFARDVFPGVLDSKPMYAFRSDCYMREVGQPIRYDKAKEEIESGKVKLD